MYARNKLQCFSVINYYNCNIATSRAIDGEGECHEFGYHDLLRIIAIKTTVNQEAKVNLNLLVIYINRRNNYC